MALPIGHIVNSRYRVVSVLGEGGMSVVCRAWDLNLKVPVALKEMTPQTSLDGQPLDHWKEQFQLEAHVLARLDHQNLVDVTDYFQEAGNAYLVMKFVEGESLQTLIERGGALPETRVLAWSVQILSALDYCHGQGVIHRDVKPANIIVRPDGQAVLVDFGLVKLLDPNNPRTRTIMMNMGTPEYAPPEQYESQPGHTGAWSDVYSVGATLYHALTGLAPPTASQRMVAPKEFRSLRQVNPQVSTKTEAAVLRAMSMEREQRFPDAAAMAAALTGQERRYPAWAFPGGALLLIIVLVAGGWWLFTRGETAPVPTPTAAFAVNPTVSPTETATPSKPTSTLAPTSTPVSSTAPNPSPTVTLSAEVVVSDKDGMVLVSVPAGKFLMGSRLGDPDADDDESPQHAVFVSNFWIDQTEVTNVMFANFVNSTGYVTDAERTGGSLIWSEDNERMLVDGANWQHPHGPGTNIAGLDDHPVVQVSWNDAVAYCQWVDRRLPTEAEWEKAARGVNRQRYPWGSQRPAGHLLNFADRNLPVDWADNAADDGHRHTAPAGSYPAGASPYDVLDMGGNVYEWASDWYGRDYYAVSDESDPTGPADGEVRVLRGGSWASSDVYNRTTFRLWQSPDESTDAYGFRCALSADVTDDDPLASTRYMNVPPTPTTSVPPIPTTSDKGLIAYEVESGDVWSIWTLRPNGQERRFMNGIPGNSRVPNFSPVDGRIAFRVLVDDTWQVHTLRPDGDELRQLTTPPGNNMEPAWSPDGQRIAFVSDRDGMKSIFVMDAFGRNQLRLTGPSSREDDPSWSPDGQWIVFESDRDGKYDIYKMRPDGSDLTRLTFSREWNATPAWSPNGEWIAFESGAGEQAHIWIMRPDGTEQQRLTAVGPINHRPAWSPDGSQIAYTSDRSGDMEIWVMAADGTQSRQLTFEGGAYNAAWSR